MIWIVLPAYNEEQALPKLLPKLDAALKQHGQPYRMVVVNDGSSDRTPEILEQFAARLPLDVVEKVVRDSVAARRQRVSQGTVPTQADLLKLWGIKEEKAVAPVDVIAKTVVVPPGIAAKQAAKAARKVAAKKAAAISKAAARR